MGSGLIGDSTTDASRTNLNYRKFNIPKFHTNIAQFNARSLDNSFDDVKMLFNGSDFHIIGVTETWLKGYSKHPSKKIVIDGYRMVRHDRLLTKTNNKTKKGGGVAFYVKKDENIKCKIIAKSEINDELEFLLDEFKFVLLNFVLLTGVVYRPNKTVSFIKLENILGDILPHYDNHFLMWDFNVNILNDSTERQTLYDYLLAPPLELLPKHPHCWIFLLLIGTILFL